MGEGGNTRKFWIKHPFHFCSSQPSEKPRESVSSPNPWAHGSSSPRIPQRAQCLMLAKHGHTETKSTERQQRNPKLDTENTTSNVISIIILSKTCRLIFAECFLLFSFFVFFFSTYLLHIKSCKENSADRRSPWMRHSIPNQSQEEGEREEEKEKGREREEGGRGGQEGRQASTLVCLPAQVQHEVGKYVSGALFCPS